VGLLDDYRPLGPRDDPASVEALTPAYPRPIGERPVAHDLSFLASASVTPVRPTAHAPPPSKSWNGSRANPGPSARFGCKSRRPTKERRRAARRSGATGECLAWKDPSPLILRPHPFPGKLAGRGSGRVGGEVVRLRFRGCGFTDPSPLPR
jgi:hypothetical protein